MNQHDENRKPDLQKLSNEVIQGGEKRNSAFFLLLSALMIGLLFLLAVAGSRHYRPEPPPGEASVVANNDDFPSAPPPSLPAASPAPLAGSSVEADQQLVALVHEQRYLAETGDTRAQHEMALLILSNPDAEWQAEGYKWILIASENPAYPERDAIQKVFLNPPPQQTLDEARKRYDAWKAAGVGLLGRARAGDADAQYRMGVLLLEGGDGVRADPVMSLIWFRHAAAQNLAEAQFAAGKGYCFGQGDPWNYDFNLEPNDPGHVMTASPEDMTTGLMWHLLAMRSVDGMGENEYRCHQYLTPEQIAEAHRRADAWQHSVP